MSCIRSACFDVFEEEPTTASPLFELEKVVVTPHLGASTHEAQDKAGVTIGDLMLALDNTPTADTDNVQTILGGREVGDVVRAKFLRGGEVIEVEITLGERPAKNR